MVVPLTSADVAHPPRPSPRHLDAARSTGPEAGVDTIYDVTQYGMNNRPNKRAFGVRPLVKMITEVKQVKKVVDGNEVTQDKEWKYAVLGPYEWISQSSPPGSPAPSDSVAETFPHVRPQPTASSVRRSAGSLPVSGSSEWAGGRARRTSSSTSTPRPGEQRARPRPLSCPCPATGLTPCPTCDSFLA